LPLTANRRALKALLVFSMPVNIQFSKISIASTIGKTQMFCELLISLGRE
jgi:hypothetical protein